MSEQPSSKERATTATNEINEMNSNNETQQAAPKPSSNSRLTHALDRVATYRKDPTTLLPYARSMIALADEIERLTRCLATANANHERFEREWYLRGDEIERLQQRVAELEPYQARTERLCNLIMGLNPNEGLSPGALSGLQRMAEAAKRASTPPAATHTQWQRDRLAKYIARDKPELPDHACGECVPGGDLVIEDFQCCYHTALKIIGTSETKSACCRQSPCLHPGVGPCDMPAVEKSEKRPHSAWYSSVCGGFSCHTCGAHAESVAAILAVEADCTKRCVSSMVKPDVSARAATETSGDAPAAELAAGIEWLKQEICDGEEYLQRYPNSVDELAQQEHRQRLLDAITGSAQPPIDARVHPDTHLIDSQGMRSTLNDMAARADSTKPGSDV